MVHVFAGLIFGATALAAGFSLLAFSDDPYWMGLAVVICVGGVVGAMVVMLLGELAVGRHDEDDVEAP